MKPVFGPEAQNEIAKSVAEYLSRRGVRKNILAGKGVLLHPPFSFKTHSEAAITTVAIHGSNSSARFECTRVVSSAYRPNIAFVLNDPARTLLVRRLTPLQRARLKLLNCVKPMSKMGASHFYERSRKQGGETQVNARRRWGELRTEYGFDTTYEDRSKMFRRGNSLPIEEPNPRPSMNRLNRDFWKAIYETNQGRCAKCGVKVRFQDDDEGNPGLLDHRRPVPYGGSDDVENLQLFCNICNNLKNTVCQACPIGYRCESCTWAFPARFHDALVLRLSPDEANRLAREAEGKGVDPRQLAKELFLLSLRKWQ